MNYPTERQFQAKRLHQFRVEARLTCEQVDNACGLKPGRCYAIEYKGAGHVDEIKQIIQQFVPGERRLRGIGSPEARFPNAEYEAYLDARAARDY